MLAPMLCPSCWGACQGCGTCHNTGSIPDEQLSPHFKLSEFVRSSTAARLRIPNRPNLKQIERLRSLCVGILEPAREMVGPLHIDSGFRSDALNKVVGGADDSAHKDGNAADVVPLVRHVTAFQWLARLGNFDQLIWESSWIHVGHYGPNRVQRGQVLMAVPGKNGTIYAPFDPTDPRVVG